MTCNKHFECPYIHTEEHRQYWIKWANTPCANGENCSRLEKGNCRYYHPAKQMVKSHIPLSRSDYSLNCKHNHPYVPSCPLMRLTKMCEYENTICTFNHDGHKNCYNKDRCINHKAGQKNKSLVYEKHMECCNSILG